MNEQPGSTGPGSSGPEQSKLARLRARVRAMLRLRPSDTLRDAIEEFIAEEAGVPDGEERTLLRNILRIGARTVADVMVPRADVVAVEVSTSLAGVVAALNRGAHSRLPVYRDALDEVIGFVHIKDLLKFWEQPAGFQLERVVREVLFVVASTPVLDMLLEMRLKRIHMALVVDEYGGVDGLVTIEDLVEEIVGEIEDEHDRADRPQLARRPDGTVVADGRATIAELESLAGPIVSAAERDEIDTLGGLVAALCGRVPRRGELVAHPSGVEFEVMEADPRRARRLRIRNLRAPMADEAAE
jgi:CBS domain containing-hemolysin-like protein